MKRNLAIYILAMNLLVALAMPLGVPAQHGAMQNGKAEHHTYEVIDLGTFGGPNGYLAGDSPFLNNQGTVVGEADTNLPDPSSPFCFQNCLLDPAFVWQNGTLTNLGALAPGIDSFAFAINSGGQIVGLSENGATDPLTGFPETRGVVWQNGRIFDIGTLGGYDSIANAINDRGEVAGGAINTTPDAFSNCLQPFGPYATQVHAVRWQGGVVHDLGTLGGNDSCALFINNRGEIAGFSFTNSVPNATTGMPTQDPFLWTGGQMIDLGTLGGTSGFPADVNNGGLVTGASNIAGDGTEHPFIWSKSQGMQDLFLGGGLGGTFGHADWLNDAGEVVGFALLTGDQLGHAFLWRNGAMTDLGTLGTDPFSESNSINSRSQAVGETFSPDGTDLRGFLWENGGPMVDLNTLAKPGSGIYLTSALQVNDRGEIAAVGVLPNGDIHGVLLIPQGDCDDACEARIADGQYHPASNPAQVMARGLKANQPGHFSRRYRLSNLASASN